jgi:hypothetical protein
MQHGRDRSAPGAGRRRLLLASLTAILTGVLLGLAGPVSAALTPPEFAPLPSHLPAGSASWTWTGDVEGGTTECQLTEDGGWFPCSGSAGVDVPAEDGTHVLTVRVTSGDEAEQATSTVVRDTVRPLVEFTGEPLDGSRSRRRTDTAPPGRSRSPTRTCSPTAPGATWSTSPVACSRPRAPTPTRPTSARSPRAPGCCRSRRSTPRATRRWRRRRRPTCTTSRRRSPRSPSPLAGQRPRPGVALRGADRRHRDLHAHRPAVRAPRRPGLRARRARAGLHPGRRHLHRVRRAGRRRRSVAPGTATRLFDDVAPERPVVRVLRAGTPVDVDSRTADPALSWTFDPRAADETASCTVLRNGSPVGDTQECTSPHGTRCPPTPTASTH